MAPDETILRNKIARNNIRNGGEAHSVCSGADQRLRELTFRNGILN